MNDLQIFNNPEFGEIRTIAENGEILFCGVDVAKALGYVKPHGAISAHCRYSLKRRVPHPQSTERTVEMVFIPESDLYRLAFRSSLPTAEHLTDWVAEEVLPSLRRTGSYSLQQTQPMTPAQLLAAQAQVLVDMEQRMNEMQTHATALEAKVDTAMKAFSRPATDHWTADMDTAVKTLCQDRRLSVTATKGRMYAELERTAGCSVSARLNRLRERKKKAGMRHRDAMALTKLDAIAADKQLRAIFEGIVRNWQAKAIVPAAETE